MEKLDLTGGKCETATGADLPIRARVLFVRWIYGNVDTK
jgi:hypothetical protein